MIHAWRSARELGRRFGEHVGWVLATGGRRPVDADVTLGSLVREVRPIYRHEFVSTDVEMLLVGLDVGSLDELDELVKAARMFMPPGAEQRVGLTMTMSAARSLVATLEGMANLPLPLHFHLRMVRLLRDVEEALLRV